MKQNCKKKKKGGTITEKNMFNAEQILRKNNYEKKNYSADERLTSFFIPRMPPG